MVIAIREKFNSVSPQKAAITCIFDCIIFVSAGATILPMLALSSLTKNTHLIIDQKLLADMTAYAWGTLDLFFFISMACFTFLFGRLIMLHGIFSKALGFTSYIFFIGDILACIGRVYNPGSNLDIIASTIALPLFTTVFTIWIAIELRKKSY